MKAYIKIKFLCVFIFITQLLLAQNENFRFSFNEQNGNQLIRENIFYLPFNGKEVIFDTVFLIGNSFSDNDILKSIKRFFANITDKPAIGLSIYNFLELRCFSNRIIYEDLENKEIQGLIAFVTPKERKPKDKFLSYGDLISCKAVFLVNQGRVRVILKDIEYFYGNSARRAIGESVGGRILGELASLSRNSFNELMRERLQKITDNYRIDYSEGVIAYSAVYYIKQLQQALQGKLVEELTNTSSYKF